MALPSKIEVEVLLDRLCVRLGLCIPTLDKQALIEDPPCGEREFTDAVFKAAGLEEGTYLLNLYRTARAMVAETYRLEEYDGA